MKLRATAEMGLIDLMSSVVHSPEEDCLYGSGGLVGSSNRKIYNWRLDLESFEIEGAPPDEKRELTQSSRLTTYQEFPDCIFELRGGDLYRVDETAETEERLVDFGYVLGFYLSKDRRRAVVVERGISGMELWTVDLVDE